MAHDEKCVVATGSHVFDLNPVVTELARMAERGTQRRLVVLLEAPEGLTQTLSRIGESLSGCAARRGVNLEYRIRVEPAFGACDVGFAEASLLGADVIVHVGHDYYPYRLYSATKPVIHLPGTQVVNESVIRELGEKLLSYIGGEPVVIGYAVQNRRVADMIAEYIRENNIRAVVVRGSVLGCYTAHIVKEVSRLSAGAVLVVAGGRFHALGVGLSLAYSRAEVYRVDPYLRVVERMTPIAEKTLRVRYWKIAKALNAQRFGLVVGVKPGQYRPWIVEYLARLMDRKGKRYTVLASNRLIVDDIVNLGGDYDAYTVTSCPRLAIEDLSDTSVPVLTPGETRMVLEENLDTYRFPW